MAIRCKQCGSFWCPEDSCTHGGRDNYDPSASPAVSPNLANVVRETAAGPLGENTLRRFNSGESDSLDEHYDRLFASLFRSSLPEDSIASDSLGD